MEGKHPKPARGEDEIQKWVRYDYMIKSWLLVTMKSEIAGSLVTMQSTKSLWEEILESVSDNYCKLKGLWDQISELEGMPECLCGAIAKCTCNIAKKMLDLQATVRLIKLLMGINSGYDQQKTNFLSREPLMHVNRAYNLVLQKKDYNKMRLEKIEKDVKKCDYYGMKGHLRDEFLKIMRYPDWFKNIPKGKRNAGNYKQAANFVHRIDEVMRAMKDNQGGVGNNNINFAVGKLVEKGEFKLLFDKNGFILQGPSIEKSEVIGRNENDLYRLIKYGDYGNNFGKMSMDDGQEREEKRNECNNGLTEYYCDTCSVAKHHKLPFFPSKTIAENVFDLIHVGLWGPYRTKTLTGASYFLTIVDDHNRVTWTHFLSNKEQVKGTLLAFFSLIENHFGTKKVKTLRSHNGTEIFQQEYGKIFADRGICHQRSVAGLPQQNARVERKYIFLLETTRALKIHAGMSSYLWGECIFFLLNGKLVLTKHPKPNTIG
ncbi:uncharacterized protein [Spinacia oleracea]|uniref:Integrase catalytic domain-containing protein n=1 Tax=Spinacia oleracea TaxID=3562 RepID=A0A9R0JM26_SPIOL|nr:uncharacterized protein LOC110779043 [Spinacia oleracea]